jgi:hypothetical protein
MGRGKRSTSCATRPRPVSRRRPQLTPKRLHVAACRFVEGLNRNPPPRIDKRTVTAIERQFHDQLEENFAHVRGSSSKGIDLPQLNYDIKITSLREPQSSAPYGHASERIFGLPYGILLLPYDDEGDGLVFIEPVLFAAAETADRRITAELRALRESGATQREIAAFLLGAGVGLSEDEIERVSARIIKEGIPQGRLVLSDAHQWRLRYSEALDEIIQRRQPIPGLPRHIEDRVF